MRTTKMLSVAGMAVFALMASIGAASAGARQVNLADGTTVAPNGTTFTSSGNATLDNGTIVNTCDMSIPGTITDNGSTGNDLTADVSPVFSNCDFATTGNAQPWVLDMTQAGNPGNVIGVDVTINAFGVNCEFAGDTVEVTWTNGAPSTVDLSGTLPLVSGPSFLCGSTGSVSGSVTIDSTSDGGNNFIIDPAP
jgi:hypothetical protein